MHEALKSLKTKAEALRKEQKTAGKKAIKELLDTFFKEHQEVRAISWTQYTPYFNDGDPCHFSVNDDAYVVLVDHVLTSGEKVEDLEEVDWGSEEDFHPTYGENKTLTENKKLGKAVSAIMAQLIDEDVEPILQEAFGDHVRVIATRDGKVTTEEYEHD